MTEVSVFRDYQTSSTLLAERERALEARRALVEELRQQVAQIQKENSALEDQLQTQGATFAHKKAVQDEKVGAKESQARAQQDRLQQLVNEEQRLVAEIGECEQQMETTSQEIARRQELEGQLHEAREQLKALKYQLEERDGKVMKLETRLARQEIATGKRHSLVDERLGANALPRVSDTKGLEDTAGESILLVDDVNY